MVYSEFAFGIARRPVGGFITGDHDAFVIEDADRRVKIGRVRVMRSGRVMRDALASDA